jgi:hypothetical protein
MTAIVDRSAALPTARFNSANIAKIAAISSAVQPTASLGEG